MSDRTQKIAGYNIVYDMIRAVASLVVFILHVKPLLLYSLDNQTAPMASFDKMLLLIAVEFFFALSGILIGKILLDILQKKHTKRTLGIFMARRVMRTFPAYYAALVLLVVFYICFGVALPDNLILYFVFLQNATGFDMSFFGPSWSLAVEELFYFFFSALLIILVGFRMKPLLKIRLAILVFIVFSVIVRNIEMMDFSKWQYEISVASFARLDSIAIAMMVITFRNWNISRSYFVLTSLILFGMMIYLVLGWNSIEPDLYNRIILNILFLAIPFSCAVIVRYLSENLDMAPNKVIIFFADISYPLYIFHMVIFFGAYHLLPSFSPLIVVVTALLCLLLCYAFHYFVERPILNLRPAYYSKR